MNKEFKSIVCIVEGNKAIELIKKLKDEKNIITANKYSARGTSSSFDFAMKEVDILTVIVDAKIVDEIFEYIYYELNLDSANSGFMFQAPSARASEYSLV